MNGIDKLFMVMQTEGAKQNPPRLSLGTMTGAKSCRIAEIEFSGDELYFAEHLLDHDAEVSVTGWDTRDTYDDGKHTLSHYHDIEIQKGKVAVKTALKKGDTVLCYPVTDEKYVIIEKVVSG